MNLMELKMNTLLKTFLNKNFISAILNVFISFIFAKYFIGYKDNFISFFSSEYGIWLNIILTYILINNIQTPYFQPPKDIFLNSFTLITIMVPIISYIEKFNLNYFFSKIYFYYILIFMLVCILLYSLYVTTKFFNEKIKTENLIYRICTVVIIKYNLLFLFSLLISVSVYEKISDIYLIIICYLIIYSKIIDNIVDTIYKKFIKNDFKITVKNYGELYRIDEPNIYRIISKENIGKNKLLLLQQENEVLKLFILKNENTRDGIIYTCIKVDTSNCKNKQSENNIIFGIEEIYDENEKNYENIVGFIVENSNVNLIRFELINNNFLKVGDVVYFLNKNNEKIFYQIVNGITHEEILNNNFVGNQIIEAMQLGILDNNKLVEYPWFPNMNEKIYKYECEENNFISENNKNFYIGNCHGLNLPIKIDIDKLITYHSAILGVTGTGKSTLAFKIIEEVAKIHKVICIDITGEYEKYFKERIKYNKFMLNFDEEIEKFNIALNDYECAPFGGGDEKDRNGNIIKGKKRLFLEELEALKDKIQKDFEGIIEKDENLILLNIPNITNDNSLIFIVKYYIQNIFEYKLNNKVLTNDNKILLILEEAHTIIPEWNFLSQSESKISTGILNSVAQIALQGRKYGIGLLLISQRTALLSKTILSQCNTFFTFSLIDQTSLDFLKNFYGDTQIKIIPNLEKYHLIAHGVAIESEKPVIINTTYNDLDNIKINKNGVSKEDDISF